MRVFNGNPQIQDIFFRNSYKIMPDSDASMGYFVFDSMVNIEDKHSYFSE